MSDSSANISEHQPRGEAAAREPLPVAVGKTVTKLQSRYLGEQGDRAQAAARGTLANLRRHAGQPIESDPLSLERVLITLDPTLTEREIGSGDAPSASERAAFYSLTLFALHMQGAATPMHRRGTSFAAACGQLYAVSESQSMKPRFDALLLARHARSQLIHARSLITLMRGRGISFDYGNFARDLRSLDHPERRSGVLLRWGRDFAMGPYLSTSTTETTES